MRRIAPVTLALLLSLPAVAPAAAADPSGEPTATTLPTSSPTVEPTATPVEPSTEPSEPPVEPSIEPTVEPAPTVEPPPIVEPPPTAEPAPPTEPATDAQGRPITTDRYIVVLDPTADTAAVTTKHRQRDGIRAERTFSQAIRGFTARLDPAQRRAVAADPTVVAIVPDEVIEVAGQVNPTGISRVGARKSVVADIDNVDERVDADVAIVDTGVDPTHSDLNVVGGVNCSTTDRTAWADENGHGTHVAGTVAAKDNTIGVVGVAPGARIWAVRILNADGYGLLSWYVCGLDWILAQRDSSDPTQPLIEAVNMSVAKSGSDDQNCGYTNSDVLHRGICRLYGAGITVVAAAANESRSASNYVPAAYNEVITTSALADTDGIPGGKGGYLCGSPDVDDTFADFSNFGSDIDIIAPGKCIWSTLPGERYGYSSGTSMAAPAVTGAVALYKASRPDATPAEVRESLRSLGNFDWATSTDPDSFHEPLLDVSRLGNLGTFSLSTPSAVVDIPSRGGTAIVPVNVVRSTTFFERVRLSVTGLPAGWSARLGATSLFGWAANATSLTFTVPSTADAGSSQFNVIGTNWGRTRTATVSVEVAAQAPFTDTQSFQTSIDWLYVEGITGGCTPTLFCPKDRVTRIQMAMFLTRAFELATTTTDYFDDDDGKTGESSVNALRKAGWTAGCGPRRYCPTGSVSRIQMAMFLTRALDLPPATIDYFDDDDGMTGESSVNALRQAGLTGGCGTRAFCPSVPLTREQMAAFLHRSLGS